MRATTEGNWKIGEVLSNLSLSFYLDEDEEVCFEIWKI